MQLNSLLTLHIKRNTKIFSQINIIAPPNLFKPDLGLTLDEIDDYKFIKKIIESFGTKNELFDCQSILKLLKKNPSWSKINKHVKRKGDS